MTIISLYAVFVIVSSMVQYMADVSPIRHFHTDCVYLEIQAAGNTLVFFSAAMSNVIISILISLLSGWQLGLAILPLMPLTVMAGIVQGYMNSTYEMKSHIRTEASGRV